jgi:pimeloyl-ACP methyl ester carboxylesterase
MTRFEGNDPAWGDGAVFDGEFETEVFKSHSIDIYYTDWNKSASNPVLMLHGFNVQSHTWDPVASALSRNRRIICPDLRGHGRSSWTRDGYWSEQFAADVIDLLEREGVTSCDVVGHSLGARVGIALSGLRPDLVRRLVLSDGGPELASGGSQQSAKLASERNSRLGFSRLEDALELYEEMHPEWLPVFRQLHVQYQLRENWVGKWVERADPELAWITRSAGRKDNAELWRLAERISAPVLLLWSGKAGFLNPDLIEKYKLHIENFNEIEVASGHYIPREAPAEFCNLVAEFLDKVK